MLEEIKNKEEIRDTRLHSVALTEGISNSSDKSVEKSSFWNSIINFIFCCFK